jgi:hypothetical protein
MSDRRVGIRALTILSPVIDDEQAWPSHVQQLRMLLRSQPRDTRSPFAAIPGTHTARLAILDDLPFVSLSAGFERLNSPYLIFEANVDMDSESYFTAMAERSREFVDSVWSHCNGYPGTDNLSDFIRYLSECQLETTWCFADVNDKSVNDTLRALNIQRSVMMFIGKNQGKTGRDLKRAFVEYMNEMRVSSGMATQNSELARPK